MYPILFSLGDTAIYSLGTLMILGFIAFNLVIVQLCRVKKLNLKFWNNHIISLVLATIVGARLMYVAEHYDGFIGNWSRILTPDGFSFYGGIIAFGILFYFYAQKNKEDILVWADVFSVAFFSWLFFSGIGHFLDGSNYGIPSNVPWAVTFDNILAPVEYTVPIHPTQLYESLYSLLIFGLLWYTIRRFKFKGLIACLGAFLLSLGHFFLSYLIGESSTMVGVLHLSQVMDLIFIALSGGILLSFLLKRHEI